MTDNTYDAVIFDNDGVLVELTDWDRLAEAVIESFDEFDVTPEESIIQRATGEGDLPFDEVESTYGLDPEEWWDRREVLVSAIQQEDIRNGQKVLYDDVDALNDIPCQLGVVSNNQHETIEFILEYYDLTALFETYYGRDPTVDGATHKKPNPHYLERALADLDTRNALYVGDSEKDVVAAERAGIDSVFLRREHRRDVTLSVEPTYEFGDLRSFVDALNDDGLFAETAERQPLR